MSSIFISHSSRNRPVAEELRVGLEARGYGSVFLDVDPVSGIAPGQSWEKELYKRLRGCRVLIVLHSKHWTASRWCFAEFTHARALGKHVIPVQIDPTPLDPLLGELQAIDATEGWGGAYDRLLEGLKAAGIEPFAKVWDRGDSPFPGLLAFEEEDAPVFFGRDEEIRDGLNLFNQLYNFGGPRLVLVLGASGSGKSSLVRAGLRPRLKQDASRWLVLKPFRPLGRPFAELAGALAGCFSQLGVRREAGPMAEEIRSAAEDPAAAVQWMRSLVDQLREASGRPAATLVLTLDQCEELLTDPNGKEAGEFLRLLAAVVRASDDRLLVVGTLRSDYLASWQQHPSLDGVLFASLPVGPIPHDRIAEVITGPAEVAGIELEPGLVPAMVQDTGTPDALPLLAFTLRELWQRHGADQQLTLAEYVELGRLEGAVAGAAESVLRAHVAATGRGALENGEVRLAAEDEAGLRVALIAMAQLDEEGRYARRRVRRDAVPEQVLELLQRFVDHRLLVPRSNNEELEVRHEALFRAWGRLSGWLEENRDFLAWRRRLGETLREWERRSRADPDTLLRGAPLAEARAWRERGELNDAEKALIDASLHAERMRRRKRYMARSALGVGVVAVAVLGYGATRARADSERLESAAILNTAAEADDPLTRALLLTELRGRPAPPDAMAVARRILDSPFPVAVLRGHAPGALSAVWSPDGRRIATASADGTARVWRSDGTGEPRLLSGHRGGLSSIAFSPDGARVVTASADGTARVWPTGGTGEPIVLAGHDGEVWNAVFDPSGTRVVTAAEDGLVRVWRADRRAGPLVLGSAESAVLDAAFSPDGRRIATASQDGSVRVWQADTPAPPLLLHSGHSDAVHHVEFSRDGERLLTASRDGTARVSRIHGAAAPLVFDPVAGPVWHAGFDPAGSHLVTASDGVVHLWRSDGEGEPVALSGHGDRVWNAGFSPDGSRVITASEDGTARLWWTADTADVAVLRGHRGAVLGAAFSPDGSRAVTVSDDGTARVWRVDGSGDPVVFRGGAAEIASLAFDAAGARIAVGGMDGRVQVWPLDHSSGPVVLADRGGAVRDLEFSPDGSRIAAVSDDSTVVVRAADGRGTPTVLRGHGATVNSVAWSPDGSRLATASDDHTARVWRADDGEEVTAFAEHGRWIRTVAFSPDGAFVVTASGDSTARVWRADGRGEAVVLRGHTGPVQSAFFDGRGDRVVTASTDSTARIWSAAGDEKPVVLRGHQGWVRSARFSPDGSRVVTASADATARVWRPDGGGEPVLLARHRGPLWDAVFTPDGALVLTSSEDGTARLQPPDRSREPVVLGGHRGAVQRVAMSTDGRRVATVATGRGAVRVWRVRWEDLLDHLRGATSACLDPEERVWLLNRPRARARSEFEACERGYRRSTGAAHRPR